MDNKVYIWPELKIQIIHLRLHQYSHLHNQFGFVPPPNTHHQNWRHCIIKTKSILRIDALTTLADNEIHRPIRWTDRQKRSRREIPASEVHINKKKPSFIVSVSWQQWNLCWVLFERQEKQMEKWNRREEKKRGVFWSLFSVCCFFCSLLSPNVGSICSTSSSEGHGGRMRISRIRKKEEVELLLLLFFLSTFGLNKFFQIHIPTHSHARWSNSDDLSWTPFFQLGLRSNFTVHWVLNKGFSSSSSSPSLGSWHAKPSPTSYRGSLLSVVKPLSLQFSICEWGWGWSIANV